MDSCSSISFKWWLCCLGSSILILVLVSEYGRSSVVRFSVLQNVVLIPALTDIDQPSRLSDKAFLDHINFSTTITGAPTTSPSDPSTEEAGNVTDEMKANELGKEVKCDIFDGSWVYSPETAPLYNAAKCTFLSDQVSCQKNGRPDSGYEKWAWKPRRCLLPRFEGRDMLEKLRGKRLILVGDSLNRNQWESLACLLYSSVNPEDVIIDSNRNEYKIFHAKNYNCSVEFYWNPLLVHLEVSHENGEKLLKLDKIHATESHWRGASIMVFNSGHWWTHHGKLRSWDSYEVEGKLVKDMEIENAFEIGIKTWLRWIKENVDTSMTKVFFRSISPVHNGKYGCTNQTEPIVGFNDSSAFPRTLRGIVEKTLAGTKSSATLLNITDISLSRGDAHPSYYSTKRGKILMKTKETSYHPDCSHWCLPGVPDIWNNLLYASILIPSSEDMPGSSGSVV